MEKYITFSVQIQKCNDGKMITKSLSFIDSLSLCLLHFQRMLITCLEFLTV